MINLSKPEAVICDMDGTLVDSEGFAKEIWQRAASTLGYAIPEEILLGMVGSSVQITNQKFIDHFGESFDILALRSKKLEIELMNYGKGLITSKPAAVEFLTLVKRLNLPLALGTSTERERTTLRLGESKLSNFFDFILCGDEVREQKPNPEVYLTISEKLNVPIKNCLIIEDSPSGVRAALSSGAQVIWIKDQVDIPSALKDQVLIYNSLIEVIPDLKNLYSY
jgi:beta-phosphoglucomutase-like phosphatase (HAD superfamily)